MLLLLLSLVLILTGCSITNNSIEEQIPTSGSIVVGKTEYEMMPGKYTYRGETMKISTLEDKSVYEIAEGFDTLNVEKNESIEIILEDNPSLTVNEWNDVGEVKEITIKDNKITVQSEAGIYIYEVVAKWPNGEASFIFEVETK